MTDPLTPEEEAEVRARDASVPWTAALGTGEWTHEAAWQAVDDRRRLLATLDAERGDRERQFREWKAAQDISVAEWQRQIDAARTASVAGLDERVAEAIYDAMRENDPEGRDHPWVPGGNSRKQEEARRRARAALNSAPSIEQEPGETLRAAVLYGPDVEFPNLPNGPYLTGPDVLLAVAHYMDRQDDEAERMAAGSGYRANRDVQAHLREWSRRLRAALEADRNPQETERSIDARRGFFCTARGRGLADWCSVHGDIDGKVSIAQHIQTAHDMDYDTYRVISELDYHRSGLTTEEGYAEERRLGIAAATGNPQ